MNLNKSREVVFFFHRGQLDRFVLIVSELARRLPGMGITLWALGGKDQEAAERASGFPKKVNLAANHAKQHSLGNGDAKWATWLFWLLEIECQAWGEHATGPV